MVKDGKDAFMEHIRSTFDGEVNKDCAYGKLFPISEFQGIIVESLLGTLVA